MRRSNGARKTTGGIVPRKHLACSFVRRFRTAAAPDDEAAAAAAAAAEQAAAAAAAASRVRAAVGAEGTLGAIAAARGAAACGASSSAAATAAGAATTAATAAAAGAAGDDVMVEDQQAVECADARAVIERHGAVYTSAVTPVGVPVEVLERMNGLKARRQWYQLPQDERDAIRGMNPAFKLFQYGSGEAYSLHLTRGVRCDEVVLAYVGKLYTRESWEEKHPDNTDKTHLWTYDLDAKGAIKKDGYVGPDLVVAGDEACNEGRYLQDSAWYSSKYPPEHNLTNRVLWTTGPSHGDQVLPYILYCASKDLPAGTELDADWGAECWMALSQHEVMLQAAVSWQHHFLHRHLQRHVEEASKDGAAGGAAATAAAGVAAGGKGGKARSVKRLGGAGEGAAAGGSGSGAAGGSGGAGGSGSGGAGGSGSGSGNGAGVRLPAQAAAAAPLSLSPAVVSFERGVGYIDAAAAAAAAAAPGATHGSSPGGTAASGSSKQTAWRLPEHKLCYRPLTQTQLEAVFPGFAREVDFRILDKGALDRYQPRKVSGSRKQLSSEEEDLIASGDTLSCVVAEVRGLHHSVRWNTTPDHKAYTLLASRRIAKGEPIGIYAGVMRKSTDTVTDPEDEMYAVDLPAAKLRSLCPGLEWPKDGLVLDARRRGNATRFINDTWGQDESRTPNVDWKVVWSRAKNRPYLMLYASEDIDKGDELLKTYGHDYWLYFSRYLQIAHYHYHEAVSAQIAALQEWVRREQGEQRLAELLATGRVVDINAKLLYDV